MRTTALALVIALVFGAGCTRNGQIGLGVVTLAAGTGSLAAGKFGEHNSEAPDGRLVLYPLGIGLRSGHLAAKATTGSEPHEVIRASRTRTARAGR